MSLIATPPWISPTAGHGAVASCTPDQGDSDDTKDDKGPAIVPVYLWAGPDVNISSLLKNDPDKWGMIIPPNQQAGADQSFTFGGTYTVEAFSASLWAPPSDNAASTFVGTPTAKLSVSLPNLVSWSVLTDRDMTTVCHYWSG